MVAELRLYQLLTHADWQTTSRTREVPLGAMDRRASPRLSSGSSSRRPKVHWLHPIVRILSVLSVMMIVTGCAGRIMGASLDRACPERTLSPSQSQALFDKVGALINFDHEHHDASALKKALPLLKTAALNGHTKARHQLTSHLIQAGVINMTNGPFPWRTSLSVAQEGIMWMILSAHLGSREIPAHDQPTFKVLLDPSAPFPQGFMNQSGGTAWMFQMLTESSLERARQQAYAWKDCW